MMASSIGRTRHAALTYSSIHILTILLISFFDPVFAQSTTSSTATQTWTPAPTCSNGLANPAAQNGTYVDKYGANWAVQCGQDSTGYVYDAYEGTNSQGVYACFKGCDSRPRCTAFMFQGTVSGATAGAGRCYYKYNAGTYYTNTTVYAAANLISNGTPNLVCPYYNLTTYTASDNSVWQVSCGYDVTANSASTAQGTAGSVAQCMAQCNAISDCSLFSYTYIGAEPADGAANADGTCYYKKGSYAVYGGGTATVAALVRIGTVTNGQTSYSISPSTQPASTTSSSASVSLSSVSTSTTSIGSTTSASPSTPSSTSTVLSTSSSSISAAQQALITTSTSSSVQSTSTVLFSSSSSSFALASSSSSSQVLTSSSSAITSTQQSTTVSSSTTAASGTATCTLNPVPSNPVCPGANQQMFTDSCGSNYTVYCGYDTNPGAASSVSASSLLQCMQACDNYSGCQAATWNGGNPGTCYLKTGYSGTFASSGVQAMVRYAPNPAYPAPIQAPAVNTSSGCGSTLPAGLTAGGNTVLFNYTNPSDGLLRNYTVHIPLYYDANHASPVIFAFPGNGEGAGNIEQETGLSNAGTNPYAIAVYVNGYALGFESHPNWAPGKPYGFVDDIVFMKNLIANITASFCVDTGKIWATGHSNGGGFVNVMACDPVLSTQIAVFTSNSGAYYTNASSGDPSTIEPLNTPVQALCSPGRANLPFLEMHGTNDQTINYYGGVRNGKLLPTVPHWATDWAIRDNLSSSNVTTQPSSGVTQYQFGGLSGNLGQITQLTLANWVHQWPTIAGGAPVEGSSIIMPFFYTQSNYSRAAVYVNTTNSSTSSISSSTSYTVSTLSSSVSVLANTTSTITGVSSTISSILTSSGGPLVTLSLTLPSLNTGGMSSSLATSSVTQSLSSSSTSLSQSSSSSSGSLSFSLSTSAVSPSSSASTNTLSSSTGGAPGYPVSSSTQSSSSVTSSSVGAPGYPISSSTQSLSISSSQFASSSATSSSVGAPGYATSSSSQSPGTSSTSSSYSSTASSGSVSASPSVSSSSIGSTSSSMTSSGSTTSPISTSSISSSASPLNSSPPSFICPANNGTIAPDQNSVVYQIHCGADTYGSNAGVVGAANSFDDCFYLCDSTSGCLAFTYSGGTNGVGSGICYLKSGIVGFASGNANTVAAVRYTGQYSASQPPTSNQVSSTASGSSSGASTSSVSRTSNPGNYGSSTSTSSSMLNPGNYGSSSTTSSSLNNPGNYGSTSSVSLVSSTSSSSSSALISSSSMSSSQFSSMAVVSSSSSLSISLPTNPIVYSSSSSSSLGSSTSLSSSTSVQSSSTVSSSSVPGYYGSSSSSTVQSTSSGISSASSSSANPPQYTPSSASSISLSVTSQSSMTSSSSMQTSQLSTSSQQQSTQSAPQSGQSSSSSSATSSASPVPSSYYGVSCPASNGQTITDQYGIKYVVSCSSDTVPAGNYDSSSASYGFTDCFGLCDNSTTVQGVGYCNSFTYYGSPNGAGPGTCFFKSNANPVVVPSDSNHVAAIRVGAPASSTLASSSNVQSSSSSMSVTSSASNTPPPYGYSTSTTLGASSSSQALTSSMSSSSSPSAQYGPVSSTATSSMMAPPQYSLSSSSTMSSSSPVPPQYSTSSTSIAQSSTISSPAQYTVASSSSGQSTSSINPPQYSVSSSQSTTNLVPPGYSSMASSVQVVSISTTASSTLVQSSAPACPSLTCGYSQSNQTCSDTYGNSFSVACSRAYTGTIAVRATKNNVNDCLTACDMTAGCVAANYMPDTRECDLLSSVNGTMMVPGAAAASRPAGVSTVYTAPPTSMSASTTWSQALTLPPGGYSNGISSTSNSVVMSSSLLPPGQYSQSSPLASSTASTTSPLPPGQYSQSSPALTISTSAMTSVLSPPGYGVSASSIFGGTANSVSIPGYGSGFSPVLQSTSTMASAPGYGSASMPITSALSTTAQSHASSSISGPASYPTDSICPQYDGKQYTDAQGNTYSVECNMAYSGTVLSQVAKRQAQAYSSLSATSGQRSHNTPQSCMQICDSIDACIAFTIVGTNLCTFYSSVNGNTIAPGSIALYRVSRPGANISVITVSTCAATAVSTTTRYTTVQSTTTIQCSDGSMCATMS